MEFPPQNVKMPIFLSDDTSTLAAQCLEETLQNPTSNSPFATINETYHSALRSMAELSNIITKDAEQQ